MIAPDYQQYPEQSGEGRTTTADDWAEVATALEGVLTAVKALPTA